MTENIRPIMYLVVIGMSFTLHDQWMVAIQAAVGGIALGAWIERRLRRGWIPVSQ